MLQPTNRQHASRPATTFEEAHDLSFHSESRRDIPAPAESLFSYPDDHNRLSGYMSQSSWMMAASRIALELDASKGQAIGSHIRLKGKVLGIPLNVEEVVTKRAPPLRKVWQTIGSPKLLVIGRYRMGFEVSPQGASSLLRIFIDYALPETPLARWLGRWLGGFYVRWCTASMARDAEAYFTRSDQQHRSTEATS